MKLPIIAISTSHLNSAIGIIRISFGNNYLIDLNSYFLKIFKRKLIPRYATFVNFYYNNKILDNGIVIYFLHPNSYTGEDMLEFQGHGNYKNLNYILNVFLIIFKDLGIKKAKKGDFSKRAFINKKITLFHIQNLSNLINNNSVSLSIIHNNLTNNIFLKLNKIFIILKNIWNTIKYIIYNNDNLNVLLKIKFKYKLNYISKKLIEIYKNTKNNSILLNNMSIILLGLPNTGKSTIINKLINKNSLIVSSIPGTTRDLINRVFLINNFKVDIYDTAGLHLKINKLEKLGIKFAFKQLKRSNIVLYILDNKYKINKFFKKITKFINKFKIFLLIFNKIDLTDNIISLEIFMIDFIKSINVKISAKYNLGINILYIELGRIIININHFDFNNNLQFIKKIYHNIVSFTKLINKDSSLDIISFIINNLIQNFEKIFIINKGNLNNLFKNFCIGK